jgi:formate dehydrogenase (NADP+) alpha subunit
MDLSRIGLRGESCSDAPPEDATSDSSPREPTVRIRSAPASEVQRRGEGPETPQASQEGVPERLRITIDGRKCSAPDGSTVLEAIRQAGLYVPTLCHDPELRSYGACRLCIVQIEGLRGLPTSCTTPAREGMVVWTETDEVQKVRRTIVEMAIAEHPQDCLVCPKSEHCELLQVARYLGVSRDSVDRLRRTGSTRPKDESNPAYVYDPDKCILCGKCVRVCHELQGVGAIDFAFRSSDTRIVPANALPLARSACQTCGECVERCPTGALTPKLAVVPQREVKTICPYCGVGCSMYVGVRGQKIVRVRGARENAVNQGSLCVKGRFGLDFVNHPDRLTKPLLRREGVPKRARLDEPRSAFREAAWEEAVDAVAEGLSRAKSRFGSDALAVLSSAKCTNEDNYVVQKFARAVLGTNNVDHCARLCHASTVTAALAAFGDGAMTNSIADIDKADVLFVIGSNTTECHPVIGRRIKQAVRRRGTRLLVADPRTIELAGDAELHLNHRPGTDVALLNGLMHEIVELGLQDERFVRDRCEGFEEFLASLEEYSLPSVEAITGVPVETLRKAAELLGRAERVIVLYGMGITQHTTGTDNVKGVANLLMLTGNIGREGTGFSPLRGQNNVQGSCDMGALPNVYPGYQRVDDAAVRAKFEKAWGRKLNAKPGLTLTDMVQAAHEKRLKAMYIVGENPMMSEPDLQHARQALAALDFLAVQDLFLTETAQLADVILPAASFAEKEGTFTNTERRVQLVRRALEPPGLARGDWEIVASLSARLAYPLPYRESAEILAEAASLTPIYGGISHERLTSGDGLQWPCRDSTDPGTATLHAERFTRGKGKFHVVRNQAPAELPSREYPLLLTTGRVLEHWHTGSMSHRSRVLEALEPEGCVELSTADIRRLGIHGGDVVTLHSPRGRLETKVRETASLRPGLAFMAFHWGDAPANLLTNPAADPLARIPEFKVSSVRAVLTVLERAAADSAFFAALAENPSEALQSFDLTPEERAALASGDITRLESLVGPLDERLKIWLRRRLEQEQW